MTFLAWAIFVFLGVKVVSDSLIKQEANSDKLDQE